MNKKRIAVVASGHIPSMWAHSINTVRHANAFKELGHQVELLSVGRYYEEKLSKNINFNEFYGTDNVEVTLFKDKSIFYYQDFPFPRIMYALKRYTNNTFSFSIDPERNISRYIKNAEFDLCFTRSYRIVQHNVYNQIPTIMESHNSNPEQSYDLLKTLKMSHSNYFRGIVTIHPKIKQKFVMLGVPEEKILTLHDAVDLKKFDMIPDDINENREFLDLPKHKKIIMYCGSLKPGKGISIILNTAAKLRSENELVFYILGGKKSEIDYWRNFGDGCHNNVIFSGFVNGDLVPRYLKSANILFIPYDSHEKKMIMDINTTSPIKLFEYMASKRPILGTDIAALNNILLDRKAALLVKNGYDEAIKSLVNDTQKCEMVAAEAYELAKQHTYTGRCERILSNLM